VTVLIIAAGYATRLYPLTVDFPKPLLEVGGRTILDHLLEQIEAIPGIDAVRLITNSRFDVDIIDNGTVSNEDRLGAVGDIRFAVEARDIDDDLLVCAADNILLFPLADFVAAFRARPTAHVCVRAIEDVEDRRRRGIVLLADDDRVLEFEEKPEEPKSEWAVPPIYFYPRATLPRIREYLDAGGTADAPGHLVEWLCRVEPVYAYRIDGTVLDIGNHASLAEARRKLGGRDP
jgi:glucose-1-phosphate thymidylyltransferase